MTDKTKAAESENETVTPDTATDTEADTTPDESLEIAAPVTSEPKKTSKAAPVLNDKDMEKVTLTTAELLKRQKKVKVKLYLPPEERQKLEAAQAGGKNIVWPYTTVQINGYTYQIQYGKDVEVPESVAEILKQADLI